MPFVTAGQPVSSVVASGTTGLVTGCSSGRLRIDPEQVDGAVAVFQSALFTLEAEVRSARYEILARPPANDAVSNDAANAFNRIGCQNAESAVAAWEGAVEQLRSIVGQLQAVKQTIINADTANVSNFQVP